MSSNNNLEKTNQNKRQNKIEKLPESIRKKILLVALIAIMTIILAVWLISLNFNLGSENKVENESWREIKKDLNTLFEGVKHNLDEIKNKFNPTEKITVPELSPNDIEKLKKKLMEKKNNN